MPNICLVQGDAFKCNSEQQKKKGKFLKSTKEAVLIAIYHQERKHEIAENREADSSHEIFSSRGSEQVDNYVKFVGLV